MMGIRRHDWVFVRADAQVSAEVRSWIAAGRPLVATRQTSDASISLGLALRDGRRIACSVAPHEVSRSRNPITVEEAVQVLDDVDAQALRRVAAAMAGHALQLGVYGSTAWEFFAGSGYRHAQSDIDVICDVASSAGLAACLDAFCDGAHYFRSRLDGEIRVGGSGHAVAWRELHEACAGGTQVVLAKNDRDVALVSLHRVVSSLR